MAAMRVWVVSELYHPEQTSTGYAMTGLAEGLAEYREVRVLCSQPTYSARGTLAPASEQRHGVFIERCVGTRFDKDRIALRIVNLLTISCSIAWALWRRVRKGDLVIVVTNPPTLPFVVHAAAKLRGARVVLRIEDVYPDALVAAGALDARSLTVRLIRAATRSLYRHMERVIVLGRDMANLAGGNLGGRADRIVVIPNWGAVDTVRPLARDANPLLESLGIADRFVVQYMGNMGRTHGVDTVAAAAERLRGEAGLHFLFIGWGARKAPLERMVAERALDRVTVLGPCSRAEVPIYANACDVAVIAFKPGMAGVSVPSRMYDVMAAGKPIVAVADAESELARVVHEERIGWVVPPEDVEALIGAFRAARAVERTTLDEMGRRARAAVERKYTREIVVAKYRTLLDQLEAQGA